MRVIGAHIVRFSGILWDSLLESTSGIVMDRNENKKY
jgi:hypothetical protein